MITLDEGRVDMYRHKCIIAATGSDYAREEKRDRVYQTGNGEHILVYGVPVIVCVNCGELTFSSENSEKVSAMLFDDEQKPRRVTIPAFEFARSETATEELLLTAHD